MSEFRVEAETHPRGVVVRLSGRAGGSEGERLEEHLSRLASAKPAVMVLDLSGLEFLSSMGVSALIRAHQSLKATGGRLRLAAVPPPILGLLEAVRLTSLAPAFGTVEEALA